MLYDQADIVTLMFAGTELPDGVMVTRPHLATSSITVASGDITYVMYSLIYADDNEDRFSLQFQNDSGRNLRHDDAVCDSIIDGKFDYVIVAGANDCDQYVHKMYALRINGSAIMDNETVLCKVIDSMSQNDGSIPMPDCTCDNLVIIYEGKEYYYVAMGIMIH